jgi:hypothetical protein
VLDQDAAIASPHPRRFSRHRCAFAFGRLLVLLLALLLGSLPARAVTHVQGGVNDDNSGTQLSSFSVSLHSAVAPGDTVVCYMFVGTTSTNVLTSVIDDKGNSYNILDEQVSSPDIVTMASAELANITNGPTTMTMNLSPATAFVSMTCDEYSGVAQSSEVDAHIMMVDDGIGAGTNSASSGMIATGSAGDFISAGIVDATGAGSSWIAGTSPLSFTLRQNLGRSNVGIASEDAPQGAAGATSATFTQNLPGEDVIVAAIALKAAPGYFVATNGSDSNSGSITSPWATLAHAQSVMEGNSCGGTPTGPCNTYIRAGTYDITATLALTSADNGTAYRYYPPDGVNSAVLDGGNTVDLFSISGASNVTIDGIKMQNVDDDAVSSSSPLSNNIIIANCDIGFNQHTSLAGGFNPMIGLGNVTNARVLNNYVHDTASQGIALYAFATGDTIDGGVVSGNVVLNTVQIMNDGGGIYINMRNNNVNGGHVVVSNNYVRDYGVAANITSARAIYLDDDASNVTVTGNVLGPPTTGITGTIEAALQNRGANNLIANNVIDLGLSNNIAVFTGAQPGDGGGGTIAYTQPANTPNVIAGNIVIENFAGANGVQGFSESGHIYDEATDTTSAGLAITTNAYHNYGGGAEDTQGNVINDASPQHLTAAQLALTCPSGVYTLDSTSAAFDSPVNFPGLPNGWGPPGFTIPASTNHSC